MGVRSGARQNHGSGDRLRGRVLLEKLQRLGAVGGVELVLEKDVLQLQLAHFFLEFAVLLVCVVDNDVVTVAAESNAGEALIDTVDACAGPEQPDDYSAH